MEEILRQLENMALMGLPGPTRTQEQIRDLVWQLRTLPSFNGLSDEDLEVVSRRLEERVSVTQQLGSVLVHREHVPWLESAKQHIEPYYWDRYRQYLTGRGFPPDVVTTLDWVTDRDSRIHGKPPQF